MSVNYVFKTFINTEIRLQFYSHLSFKLWAENLS